MFDAFGNKKMLAQGDNEGRETIVTVKDNSEEGKSKKVKGKSLVSP